MLPVIGQKIAPIEQKESTLRTAYYMKNMLASILRHVPRYIEKTVIFVSSSMATVAFYKQPQRANKFDLLMSGIRARCYATLGGKRWHLIFKRKALRML